MLYGIVPRWAGFGMFGAFWPASSPYQYWQDTGIADERRLTTRTPTRMGIDLGRQGRRVPASRAYAALVVGSEMLVVGAVAAGNALGVPEAIIGLTVIAIGTSLPELSTCLAAALKRQTNMIDRQHHRLEPVSTSCRSSASRP